MIKVVQEQFMSVLGHYTLTADLEDVTVAVRVNVCYLNPVNFPMSS
jgi:hypothetical protein